MKRRRSFILWLLLTAGVAWSMEVDPRETRSPLLSWAGVFQLKPGRYVATFSKVGGKYHSSAIRLVILKSGRSGIDAVEDLQVKAGRLSQTEPIISPGGKGILVRPAEALYQLTLEPEKASTGYGIEIEEVGTYVLFLGMRPELFSPGRYFFTDRENRAVKPDVERTY